MGVLFCGAARPTPPGNMGCCIPNDALLGIKASHIRKDSSYMGARVAPMPPRKRRAFNHKRYPHGAGKSNKKRKHSNAFSSATPVFLFKIVSALREAHSGSGPATAGAWGRHQPPHRKNLCAGSPNFPSSFSAFFALFYARKGITWDTTSTVAGGERASSPTNQNPHIQKSLRCFLKGIGSVS